MHSGLLSTENARLTKLLASGFLLLLLNSSYLAAFGEPTLVYIANIGLHFVGGWVLLLLFLRLLARTWPGLSAPFRLSALILLLSGGLGVVILAFGMTVPFLTARKPLHWVATAHVIAGVVGVLALAFALLRQRAGSPKFARAFGVVLAVALLFPVVAGYYQKYTRAGRDYIVNPVNPPLAMEGEGAGPKSPFWPSSANTNVNGIIPATFFMTSQSCARCHKEIYDQWNSSAHHMSSFNNQWYRKSIEYMQDVVGTQPSKWCAGCHDHAVFFNGRFDNPIKNQINTPEAQNGLGCLSCHSIVHVDSSMGNGGFEIEYPTLHDMATSENKVLQWGHDFLTYANPEMHTKTFIKPFMRENTPEYCASCHKVHLDKPVNGYRWFRGFNDYDNWQASGVSGQGARAFYYPDKPKKCAECHMPLIDSKDPAAKNGKIKSHRFPAANTALPFVNGDQAQLKATQDFLKDKQVTVDIFAMTPGAAKVEKAEVKEIKNRASSSAMGEDQQLASMFAVGEESASFGATQAFITKPVEVIAPLNKVANATVRRGDSMRVEVVVRTRKVGHFFPGGTVDGFDVWVELEAFDNTGRKIFWSGEVTDGGKGPVEPGAHFYRSLMLDEQGNPINKRNAWAARTVAYVRLVPPGAADTIHYRLNIPADCSDQITLKAKVNYRKFSWWNTNWSYAGVRDPQQTDLRLGPAFDNGRWLFTGDTSGVSGGMKSIPNLPITVMAEDTATLRVINAKDKLPEMKSVSSPEVRERWNDYGIGLLLQGDLKGAENVFLKVTQMEPSYADGWVNVARARIQEGEMEAAAEVLQKALALNPRLAKTNFFYALTLKAAGKYDEALKYLKVAVDQYPRDRVVQNTIGRVLFLQRRYPEAVEVLHKVLGIDPEDLQAHYNLMLSYQGLGKAEEAKREETLYRRFKADESAQAITGPYRKLHPEDNNERQQIHEHVSVAFAPAAKTPVPNANIAKSQPSAPAVRRKLVAATR